MNTRWMASTAMHRMLPSPPTDGGEGEGGGGGGSPGGEGDGGGQSGGGGDQGGGSTGGKGGKTGKGDQGGGGGEPPAFWEGFSDDLRSSHVVTRHKSAEALARSLVEAEKRMGAPAEQLIRLPEKPEDMADLYRKLGAPETADGYKIELGEGADEADKAMAQAFATYMHEKGPYPPQFLADAVAFLGEQTAAQQKAEADAAEARAVEGEATLKKAWGADFKTLSNDVGQLLNDETLGGGKALLETLALNPEKLGDNPALAIFLGHIAAGRRETTDLPGQGREVNTGPMTPAAAKAQLNALNADPVKGVALRDASHSMHKAVLEERNRLAAWAEGKEYVPPKAA